MIKTRLGHVQQLVGQDLIIGELRSRKPDQLPQRREEFAEVVLAYKTVRLTIQSRAHKNGRLEEERVTPIEAHSLVKIIERY